MPERFKDRTVLFKEEVAEIMRVSVDKIEKLIDSGVLPIIPNLGPRTVRIPKSAVEKLLSCQ